MSFSRTYALRLSPRKFIGNRDIIIMTMMLMRIIKAITSDPRIETIFLNMQAAGVGVTLRKP